ALGGLEPLDLGQAAAEILGLVLPLAGARGQLVKLAADVTVSLICPLVASEQRREVGSGEAVKRLALPAWLEQLLLIGLPVHGHQVISQADQQRYRDGPAARVGARPSLGRHRATQDQRGAPVVEVAACLVYLTGYRAVGRDAQPALHARAVGTWPHPGRVRPGAEQ